jgi:hypothetical protein
MVKKAIKFVLNKFAGCCTTLNIAGRMAKDVRGRIRRVLSRKKLNEKNKKKKAEAKQVKKLKKATRKTQASSSSTQVYVTCNFVRCVRFTMYMCWVLCVVCL